MARKARTRERLPAVIDETGRTGPIQENGRFAPGHARYGGRQKGVRNRMTRVLRDAIIMAAEIEGFDQRGADGLVGYLRLIARKDYEVFAMLLRAVLPLQVTGPDDGPVQVQMSFDEARDELNRRGIPIEHIFDVPRTVN